MSSFHAANIRCLCFLLSLQIATAVKFLQNQQVRQSPLATRKVFLKKKGERHHQHVPEPNVKRNIFTGGLDTRWLYSKTLTLNLTGRMLSFLISNMSGISVVKKAFL